MNPVLIDAVLEQAQADPLAPAIIYHQQTINRHDLIGLIGTTAMTLYQSGIRAADVVAVTMSNSPLHLFVVLALSRLGAISIPIAPRLDTNERSALIDKFHICALVTSWDDPVKLPKGVVKIDRISGVSSLFFQTYWPDADTPLRISLTSGTTGQPRGVLHSNRQFILRMHRTLFEGDVTTRLIPPDLHIVVSMISTLGTLCAGGAVVFAEGNSLQDHIDTINKHGVTHIIRTPTSLGSLQDLISYPGTALPSIKHLRLVGTTPPPDLLQFLRQYWTPNVYVPYGIAEMGPISMATPAILAEFPLSVGYVESFATVEIVDEHNNVLQDEQPGEIRIKIDGMPDGYFAEPSSATGKFRKGWFYPNDWGYRNADGLLFISGRTDNIVNFGGHKYAPEVLEQKLVSHPSIRDAAVFLDNRSGSPGMVALIVTTAVISTDELQVFGKKQLGHLAPREYRVVEQLPHNAMGKLDREKLPQMHGAL